MTTTTTQATISYYRNDETGELAPPHRVGEFEDGTPLYAFQPGWTPVDSDGNPVDVDCDGDHWWVAPETTPALLQSWQKAWRDGFAPQFSDAALEALAAGLERDDGRILQGATCSPPPMPLVADWPVEAADAVGFAYWQGDGKATVGEVEEAFARACHLADELLNEPGACRYFLNAWDETPRNVMLPALLAEVRREQSGRLDYRAELAADDRAADECAAMAESMPGQFGTTDAF